MIEYQIDISSASNWSVRNGIDFFDFENKVCSKSQGDTMRYEYFTDGSQKRNSQSSWAWVETQTGAHQLGVCRTDTTSDRMEMQGVIHAMQHALSVVTLEDEVNIYTDSNNLVIKLFEAVEGFYNNEDMKMHMSNSDLWVELLAVAVMLHESCILSVNWISRKFNKAHEYAAIARNLKPRYIKSLKVDRWQLAGGL